MQARISRVDKTRILCIVNDRQEVAARVPKRLRDERPCVGDVVELEPPPGSGPHLVTAIHPRRTLLERGTDGAPQPLAANVDVALVCTALDQDHSDRRIERYLALATAAGVRPVVLLTKADLDDGPGPGPGNGRRRSGAILVSARTGLGLDEVRAALPAGATAVLLGSSGVGKSTLVNALLGEERMRTTDVREGDGKGRHTTTHRELLRLPWGAWLIDAPGLREVGVVGDTAGAFEEIGQLASGCRFSDCAHASEPGCAVRAVVDPERLASWRALQAEAERRSMRDAERRAHARSAGRAGRDTMRGKDARRRGGE